MPEIQYPEITVALSEVDGNAVAIINAVSRAIKRRHGERAAKHYRDEARKSVSYDALIQHAMRIVRVE